MRVDAAAGVIRGIKILGLQSRNGRRYLPEALAAAAALYEGAKVNVNHPKGSPLAPRDYQERLGAVRNIMARPQEGLFGDLHFNPKHGLAAQLTWDAEHAPENVGFSHNVEARTSRQGDEVVVEAILRVQSVDLVADPATTRGLFEQLGEDGTEAASPETKPLLLSAATAEQVRSLCPKLVEELCGPHLAEIKRIERELDRLHQLEASYQRRLLIQNLLAEHQLPSPENADPAGKSLLGEAFLQSLMTAADEAAVRTLINERAQLVRQAQQWDRRRIVHPRALSRDQAHVDLAESSLLDGRGFARAISIS